MKTEENDFHYPERGTRPLAAENIWNRPINLLRGLRVRRSRKAVNPHTQNSEELMCAAPVSDCQRNRVEMRG